jgi:phosphoribosylformylglycinamidine cyclo-ligase
MDSLTYKKAGVDTEKAARILGQFGSFQKSRKRDPNVVSGIGGFAACYDLAAVLKRYEHPYLVTCCDGVGTKVKLALEWGKLDTLGEDLVAMNVNDLLCVGAEPLVFLDYYACGALKDEQLLTLLKSIQHGCELAECTLTGGETAEMPGMYHGEDFDLAGFSVGVVEKDGRLGAHRVKNGDKLLAVASSGLHSNGYSLVRKLVEQERLSPDSKAPFEGGTWREVLLKPTTIYWKPVKGVLKDIHALAHITGGGLFENLPRVLPDASRAVVESEKWDIPPLFQWLQKTARIETRDLLSTLNAGVGLIAAVAPENVNKVKSHIEGSGLRAWEIGHLETGSGSGPAEILWK